MSHSEQRQPSSPFRQVHSDVSRHFRSPDTRNKSLRLRHVRRVLVTKFLEATDVDDRGRASAESRFGADFGIVAEVSDGSATIRKDILVQAKLGLVSDLTDAERNELMRQIRNMKRVVDAPKVMEIPALGAIRDPRIISGNIVA